MKILVAAIALLLAALAQEATAAEANAPDAPIAVIPYRLDYDGAITVSVMVGGQGPYDFIIDTGATLTLAFQNLSDSRMFEPTGGPPRRVLGITGSATLDTYRMGDIVVGGAILENHVGVVIPDWAAPRRSPAGVIGLDFLRRYAVVFNVRERTIALYPHGAIPEDKINGWRSVKLRSNTYAAASGALYSTKGLINRSPTTFLIDLGSGTTMINYRAAEAMFTSVVSGDFGEGFTTGSRLNDVFDDRTRVRTALLNRIQVGRTSWRNVGVIVHDAPIFEEIGVHRLPFALLGADLIMSGDFALDFGEQRLYLGRRRTR